MLFRSKEIEKANYNKKLRKNGGLELFDKSKRYFEDKTSWENIRAEIGEIDESHVFKCVDALPWRRSLYYERAHPNDERKEAAKGPAS